MKQLAAVCISRETGAAGQRIPSQSTILRILVVYLLWVLALAFAGVSTLLAS